jgi:hypothetical protein
MVTPSKKDLERIYREIAQIKKARSRDDARTDFLTGFIWPAVGRISGVYGSQRILNGQGLSNFHLNRILVSAAGGLIIFRLAARGDFGRRRWHAGQRRFHQQLRIERLAFYPFQTLHIPAK